MWTICGSLGRRATCSEKPAYQVGTAIKHILTVGKSESAESFKETDHFGGEMKYFSDCILNGKEPEPDGEEGMLDVRVLEAIERSLETGTCRRWHRTSEASDRMCTRCRHWVQCRSRSWWSAQAERRAIAPK